jgi:hypothetical protein
MATRVILHIGTEKTGSTAIQRYLSSERAQLAKHGVAVPTSLGQAEHVRFPLLFYDADQHDDLTLGQGLNALTPSQRQFQLQRWKTEFAEELATAPQDTWIISSEHIHSRLLHNDASMASLVSFVERHFDEITVITYLREPLEAAVSLWSTAVLNGAALSTLPPPETPYWARLCNHRATVERLERWFSGRFLLRLYTPAHWLGGDVVHDFANAVGISVSPSTAASQPRLNSTLSWLSLALIARLNSNGKPSRTLVSAIREAFDHYPPPRATAQQRAAYAKTFAESNAWLFRHYFPDRSALFANWGGAAA